MSHFPVWFVMPADKSGVNNSNDGVPVVFSSVEKMSAWLGSRHDEHNWQVRLLDRAAAAETINELRSQGCTQVRVHFDGQAPRFVSLADLVLRLAEG